MHDHNYQVLLYYKYVDIKDPQTVLKEQRELCGKLSLKGRIIIATEGINGTVEGTVENTERYIEAMQKSKYFNGISFKKSSGTGVVFPRLSVKVRNEIVSAHMPEFNPNKLTGKYLSVDSLHEWFLQKKEFYIVDMRNDYEYASGYFDNSILSGMRNFYELPKVLPRIAHLKDKTVVTVCTGGIRCEKASGFLVANGFLDVYQLKDGIHAYIEKYPSQHFKGKLYVFDNRLTVGCNVDPEEYEVVGRCYYCLKPCDDYVNCEYNECHYHHIACKDCADQETNLYFCKPECKKNYSSKLQAKSK